MHVVTNVAPWFVAASAAAFLTVYSVMARWWLSPEGRALTGVGIVLFLYGCQAIAERWWPNGCQDVLKGAAHTGSVVIMVRMTSLAWNAQAVALRRGKDGPR